MTGPDDDGPIDSDGGATVTDITPEEVPPLDLTGPDLRVADIVRHQRRLAGQGAAQGGAVAVMDAEPALAEEVVSAPAQPRSARERLAEIPKGEPAIFGVLALRKGLGASTAELISASAMGRSWAHRELARWKEEGRIAQPGGKGSLYYLPEHAPSSG